MEAIKINKSDNVAVLLKDVKEREIIFIDGNKVKVINDIKNGHKIALTDIKYGENIIKYGYPIGQATKNISKGEWVHTHNVRTNLGEILNYEYKPIKFAKSDENYRIKNKTFQGNKLEGTIHAGQGTRNDSRWKRKLSGAGIRGAPPSAGKSFGGWWRMRRR